MCRKLFDHPFIIYLLQIIKRKKCMYIKSYSKKQIICAKSELHIDDKIMKFSNVTLDSVTASTYKPWTKTTPMINRSIARASKRS